MEAINIMQNVINSILRTRGLEDDDWDDITKWRNKINL